MLVDTLVGCTGSCCCCFMLSLAVPTEANEGEKGGQMRLPFDSVSELSGLDDDDRDSWLNAEKVTREEDNLSRPAYHATIGQWNDRTKGF